MDGTTKLVLSNGQKIRDVKFISSHFKKKFVRKTTNLIQVKDQSRSKVKGPVVSIYPVEKKETRPRRFEVHLVGDLNFVRR